MGAWMSFGVERSRFAEVTGCALGRVKCAEQARCRLRAFGPPLETLRLVTPRAGGTSSRQGSGSATLGRSAPLAGNPYVPLDLERLGGSRFVQKHMRSH